MQVWIRGADRSMVLSQVYLLPQGAIDLVAQDLDRDGDLDVVVSVAEGASGANKAVILYNTQMKMCSSQWEMDSSSCRPQQQLCRQAVCLAECSLLLSGLIQTSGLQKQTVEPSRQLLSSVQ